MWYKIYSNSYRIVRKNAYKIGQHAYRAAKRCRIIDGSATLTTAGKSGNARAKYESARRLRVVDCLVCTSERLLAAVLKALW